MLQPLPGLALLAAQPLLSSLLFCSPLAPGVPTHLSPWNSWIKDTVNSFTICLLGTIAGCYYLPPGRGPLTIYYLCLSTCPKLQWLVPPSLCQTSLASPLYWRPQAPAPPEASHHCCILLSRSMAETPPSFLASAFSSWDLEVPPVPSIQQLAPFFTDKSRTN